MHKKTVFITSFHTLISRNIIRTPIVTELIRNGSKIVILVPLSKLGYFEKEFTSPSIIVEGVEIGASIRTKRVGMLKRLAEALPNTRRAAMGRRLTFSGTRKYALYYYFFYLPAGVLGKSIFMMRLIRKLDYWMSPRGRFYPLLEKYKPDLVFSTDVQNEHDVALMQDAWKKKFKIIGMVRSWDNLTTRAFRFLPERLIVHNELIKDQAVSLYGVEPRTVTVTGIPHYDRYLEGPSVDRETFFKKAGLDPAKKTILFFPLCDYRVVRSATGKGDVYTDRMALEALASIDGNVIVRLPPNETVTIEGFKKPKNFFFDQPGVAFGKEYITTRELTAEDDTHLIDELSYANVAVCGPSTVAIDVAIFDRPIIFLNFNRGEGSIGQIWEYGADHIINVLKTGGTKMADNTDKLKELITLYFREPGRDREGRTRIVLEQCGVLDGKASARVVSVLMETLSIV